jgi:uncharacterized caspase-like protein
MPFRASTSLAFGFGFALAALGQTPPASAPADPRAGDFLVVDCLLPGQIRRLGGRTTYLSARRAVRTAARDCRIRGGEYVEYDRADWRSALGAWQPQAESGDAEAQTIVGEIFERGLGVTPDYTAAARWYRLAADAGDKRAQINLGHMYEAGLGVGADPRAAVNWYARAAGNDMQVELDDDRPPLPAVAPAPPTIPAAVQAELAELRAAAATQARAAEALRTAAETRAKESTGLRTELALHRGNEDALRTQLLAKDAEVAGLRAAADSRQRDADAAATAQANALAQAQAASSQATAQLAEQQRKLARLEQSAAQKLLAGPELTLVEPQLTRTRDIVPVATSRNAERELIGRVAAAAGLTALTVNDAPVEPNELGVFTSRLTLGSADLPVKVVAVDRQGKRSEINFILRAPAAAAPPAAKPTANESALAAGVKFGNYHALIIGNNDYQTLPDLTSPVNDATDLARVLQQHYGFKTTVLLNATRYQILSALNTLRETLTVDDNLLIYYAGHGELDEVNQRGHWLPVDAERDSTANWIPSTQITDVLNIMKARQVLLIADSCYAGALTRSSLGRLGTGMSAEERRHWLRTMATRRSRTVLASGGLAPVMDAGGGRHSVFAKALLDVLESNVELLDGQSLHREVAARVAYAAANLQFDQMPEYAPIRFAGHEAGEFFLLPRT